MTDWEVLDHEAVAPDDGILYLMERDGEYAIHVDGRELMTNRMHGSEDALAELACDRLQDLEDARILIGGLGIGFTLAAVLRRIGAAGNATVAELMPAVVRWSREYPDLSSPAKHPLDDPRVVVHVGDVGDLVVTPPAPWHAILLDVDNGPLALTRPANGWLYSDDGLAIAYEALAPQGILAIWSAHLDDSLSCRLLDAGFSVELVRFNEPGRATPDWSGTHILWFARRP